MLKYALLILWGKKGVPANFYAFCISDYRYGQDFSSPTMDYISTAPQIFTLLRGGGKKIVKRNIIFCLIPSSSTFPVVVPFGRAPAQVSKYVGQMGVQMVKAIVIAPQSQHRVAKVSVSRKKRHQRCC